MALENYEYAEHIERRKEKIKNLKVYVTAETVATRLKNRCTEEIIQKIIIFCNCLQAVYPDKFHFRVIFEAKSELVENTYGHDGLHYMYEVITSIVPYRFEAMIHFPHIHIKNSHDNWANLNDLYVKLLFSSAMKLDNRERGDESQYSFTGARGRVSIAEYRKRYMHSHLPSSYPGSFRKFCVGSGEIAMSQMILNEEFTEHNATMALLQILPFLEWESLEGVPHIYLSGLGGRIYYGREIPESDLDYLERRFRDLKLHIAKGRYTMDIDWVERRGQLEVVDNAKYEKFFHDLQDRLALFGSTTKEAMTRSIFIKRDETGRAFYDDNVNITDEVSHPEVYSFYFKGELITPIVEPNREDTVRPVSNTGVTMHVTEYTKNLFKTLLQEYVNTSKLKQVGIEYLNSSSY